MRLPVAQRSSVILMDVLGCSLQEVGEVMDFSLPAVKAALHRGRTQLRELADEPDDQPQPKLSEADRDRLGAYVAHFNARDFDAIRAMIADDVRLDLVNKTRHERQGRGFPIFRKLFERSVTGIWSPGLVEGRPAILVFDPNAPRLGAEIFHAAATGRPTRSRPSATSATRPTSSKARNIASEIEDLRGAPLSIWGRATAVIAAKPAL